MSNSNNSNQSNQLSLHIAVLRAVAGGIGASIGLGVSFGLLLLIGALQGLGLIGGPFFEGSSVWGFLIAAMLIGGIWGIGTLKWRPSMGRALFAAIGGFMLVAVAMMILRWQLGLVPWAAGSILLFGGFAAGFSALWGMGAARRGYDQVETSGLAVEHDIEAPVLVPGAFNPITRGRALAHFSRTKILPVVLPLLGPLVIALGVAMIGAVIAMVFGAFGPAVVQTNNMGAAATTPAGYMDGMTLFGGPVSKLAFFLFIAVLLLGAIGTMALGLALLLNALSVEIKDAQKMSPAPLDFSENNATRGPLWRVVNLISRLIKFFRDWVADITNGAVHSISR